MARKAHDVGQKAARVNEKWDGPTDQSGADKPGRGGIGHAEEHRSPSVCYVRPSYVLIDDPQLCAKDRLELPLVFVIQLADAGVHRIERKATKSLGPFINKVIQC